MDIKISKTPTYDLLNLTLDDGLQVGLVDVGAGLAYVKMGEDYLTRPIPTGILLRCYDGKTIGPIANRIKGDTFEFNGQRYHLPANEKGNILHSSSLALNGRRFTYSHKTLCDGSLAVYFAYYLLPEEGEFPSPVEVLVTYTFYSTHGFSILIEATPEADCPLSLTNHAYFTLGEKEITGVKLFLDADSVATYDHELIVQSYVPVKGPTDFRTFKKIGQDIHCDEFMANPKLHGYDHCFVLAHKKPHSLIAVGSKYAMAVQTNAEAMQLYTSNSPDAQGIVHDSFAVEPEKALGPVSRYTVKGKTTDQLSITYSFFKTEELR